MNIETLKKLERNPHYKLSDKQKKQLRDAERTPMKKLEIHNTSVPRHEVKITRTRKSGRTGKKSK
jgi:hypothetical protein